MKITGEGVVMDTADHWMHVRSALNKRHLTNFLSPEAARSVEQIIAEGLTVTRGQAVNHVVWESLSVHPFASLLSDAWKRQCAAVIQGHYEEMEKP